MSNSPNFTPSKYTRYTVPSNVAFARNPQACHFMDHKDIHFKPLHNVLDILPKKLLTEGVGAEKKRPGL